jgi:transposase InsO family protein
LREWAYARADRYSAKQGRAMLPWIAGYNHLRPHSALCGIPPAEKLNNVLGFRS